MNIISIFLYLAEILPNIASAATGGVAIICAFWVIYAIVASIMYSDATDMYAKTSDEYKRASAYYSERKYLPPKWLVFVTIALLSISILIPSKQTIYMIAGSELGEMVIQTDEAREIYEDIQSVIRSYAVQPDSTD